MELQLSFRSGALGTVLAPPQRAAPQRAGSCMLTVTSFSIAFAALPMRTKPVRVIVLRWGPGLKDAGDGKLISPEDLIREESLWSPRGNDTMYYTLLSQQELWVVMDSTKIQHCAGYSTSGLEPGPQGKQVGSLILRLQWFLLALAPRCGKLLKRKQRPYLSSVYFRFLISDTLNPVG